MYRFVHHLIPMVVVQKRLFHLKWTLWCDDEPNLIQIGKLHQMVRNHQMAYVYGIKCPKKEAYLLHRLVVFRRNLDP